jgi:hypothetical protein
MNNQEPDNNTAMYISFKWKRELDKESCILRNISFYRSLKTNAIQLRVFFSEPLNNSTLFIPQ